MHNLKFIFGFGGQSQKAKYWKFDQSTGISSWDIEEWIHKKYIICVIQWTCYTHKRIYFNHICIYAFFVFEDLLRFIFFLSNSFSLSLKKLIFFMFIVWLYKNIAIIVKPCLNNKFKFHYFSLSVLNRVDNIEVI